MDGARRDNGGPRLARVLAALTVAWGLIYAVGTVAYMINTATRAGGQVMVPVAVLDPSAVRYPDGDGQGSAVALLGPTPATTTPNPRLDLVDPPARGAGWIETDQASAVLRASGSTVTEQVLSRAGLAFGGVCLAIGALILRPLLPSIAEGEPFRRGNAARIAGLGGLELISWIGSLVLPFLATQTVLHRLDVGPAVLGSPFTLSTGPVLVALFALVLAQAFRRGGELARDADGLV